MSEHSTECPICEEVVIVHWAKGYPATRIDPGVPDEIEGVDGCKCHTLLLGGSPIADWTLEKLEEYYGDEIYSSMYEPEWEPEMEYDDER